MIHTSPHCRVPEQTSDAEVACNYTSLQLHERVILLLLWHRLRSGLVYAKLDFFIFPADDALIILWTKRHLTWYWASKNPVLTSGHRISQLGLAYLAFGVDSIGFTYCLTSHWNQLKQFTKMARNCRIHQIRTDFIEFVEWHKIIRMGRNV